MLEAEGNCGYDAAANRYVDLVQASIIDPTKVVRIALENLGGGRPVAHGGHHDKTTRKKEVRGTRNGSANQYHISDHNLLNCDIFYASRPEVLRNLWCATSGPVALARYPSP